MSKAERSNPNPTKTWRAPINEETHLDLEIWSEDLAEGEESSGEYRLKLNFDSGYVLVANIWGQWAWYRQYETTNQRVPASAVRLENRDQASDLIERLAVQLRSETTPRANGFGEKDFEALIEATKSQL